MARERASEKEVIELVTALGTALAQWGEVEGQLYLLYAALCEPGPFPNTHSVIYETVVPLDTKLSIIDALVEFKVKDDALLARWAKLLSKIKSKTRRVRNKLAHWRVYQSTDEKHFPVFLGPPITVQTQNIPDFGTSHGGAMRAKDIIEHAKNFTALAAEIREFTNAYRPGVLPIRK